MPVYEYRCRACGNRFEKISSISARDAVKCDSCGGDVERVYEGRCAFGSNSRKEDSRGGCSGNCAGCGGCCHA